MIERPDLPSDARASFPSEYARYEEFLATHTERTATPGGLPVPVCVCGKGPRTVLLLAGGLGGVDLLYDIVSHLERRHRVVVIDVSAFDDPDAMSDDIDTVRCCGD